MLQDITLEQASNGRYCPIDDQVPFQLGTGTITELYSDKTTNNSVVVKTYNKRTLSQRKLWRAKRSDAIQRPQLQSLLQRYSTFFKEIDVFKALSPTSHLVRVLDCFETTLMDEAIDFGCYYVVLEYCEAGVSARVCDDFHHDWVFVRDGYQPTLNQPVPFLYPKSMIRSLARNLFIALQYLHQRGFVHGDVKPTNIFITDKGEAKLGDYDLVQKGVREENKVVIHYVDGTTYFKAPETFSCPNGLDGAAVDIWGAGITLWIWCFNELPLLNTDDCQLEIEELDVIALLKKVTRKAYSTGRTQWEMRERGQGPEEGVTLQETSILRGLSYEELLNDVVLTEVLTRSLERDPTRRATADELVTLLSQGSDLQQTS